MRAQRIERRDARQGKAVSALRSSSICLPIFEDGRTWGQDIAARPKPLGVVSIDSDYDLRHIFQDVNTLRPLAVKSLALSAALATYQSRMAEQSLRSRAAEAVRVTQSKGGVAVPTAEIPVPTHAGEISNLSFTIDPNTEREVEKERSIIQKVLGIAQ
jgi:hypothetical protein